MKTINSITRTFRVLTGLALALAAFTFTQPAAGADALIGHWISGPTNLTDSSGFRPVGTHDGYAVGANAALLAWANDLPQPGFTGQSLNLMASNVCVLITNSAVTDGNHQTTFDAGISNRFSVACWFKQAGTAAGTLVSKSGNTPYGWQARLLVVNGQPATNRYADFTMRSQPAQTDVVAGLGTGSAIEATNVVNDGVWHHLVEVFDGTVAYRKIYVDGVLQRQVASIPYSVNYGPITNHLVIGANQNNVGGAPGTFFPGLLFDCRVYNYPISAGEVQYLNTAGLTSSKDIFTFNFPGLGAATISGTSITLTNVPFTTDITALSPTYLCSALATCRPASGTTRNFTTPQTYTVTAQDSSTKTYTVMVTKAAAPSSACDILSVTWGTYSSLIVGTNVSLLVPMGTVVTAINPTVTVSPFATVSPASGSTNDFTSPVNYTVTAQDGVTTKTYALQVVTENLWTNSAGGNWSVGGNWNPNSTPSSASTTALAFNTAGTYASTHDLGDGFQLNLLLFGAPTVTLDGNSLQFAGANPHLLNNSIVSVVVSNSLDLAVDTTLSNVGGVTLRGVISGTGALIKSGAGTLTLSGSAENTYSGGTTVNAGFLSLANTRNDYFGTGAVVVNSAAQLNLNGNGNLLNAFTFNGARVGNGNSFSAALNGPVTLAATSTFDQGTTGGMKIGGDISGPGGLTRTGTGTTLVLSGANTYAGPTTVSTGTIRYDRPEALAGGALNIASGATVNLNFTGGGSATSLTIGGTTMPNGVYGSVTNLTADITNSAFLGAGTLTVGPHIQARITSFTFLGQPAPTIDPINRTISLTVDSSTDLTTLAPTYTVSPFASGTPDSGTTLDFTTPQAYTVVSGDLSVTNVYTVTVIKLVPHPTVSGITGPVAAQFTILGSSDIAGNVVTEMTTDLTTPITWVPIQTNAVSAGAFSIEIPQGSDQSAFYRLMGQ